MIRLASARFHMKGGPSRLNPELLTSVMPTASCLTQLSLDATYSPERVAGSLLRAERHST